MISNRALAFRLHTRIVPLLILLTVSACTAPGRAGDAFGIWKVNSLRSTAPYPTTLTVRFELHAKGEVFTMDTIDVEGRVTTASTLLYLDGKPRDFQGRECSGTQTSRRVESGVMEILRKCGSGVWTRFVRRFAAQPGELILDITEQYPDGRRFERRLVLEKQADKK